eukprot:4265816-Alexandrium_andersonii.AAC.1
MCIRDRLRRGLRFGLRGALALPGRVVDNGPVHGRHEPLDLVLRPRVLEDPGRNELAARVHVVRVGEVGS